MTDITPIFATLEKAGVSITDFAKLTKISRTTLYNWKRGKNINDQLRLDRARAYVKLLDSAVAAGRLPLHEHTNPALRLATLRQILAQVNREVRG